MAAGIRCRWRSSRKGRARWRDGRKKIHRLAKCASDADARKFQTRWRCELRLLFPVVVPRCAVTLRVEYQQKCLQPGSGRKAFPRSTRNNPRPRLRSAGAAKKALRQISFFAAFCFVALMRQIIA